METGNFTTSILVANTPAEVFNTILDVRAWWSGLFEESFNGTSEKTGDEFTFLAGGGLHFTRQKLVELVPNKKVSWLVTEANLSFVEDSAEWVGTKITFDISGEIGKTKVVFTHEGLVPDFQCYDACSTAWSAYIGTQLINALQLKYENS